MVETQIKTGPVHRRLQRTAAFIIVPRRLRIFSMEGKKWQSLSIRSELACKEVGVWGGVGEGERQTGAPL